MPLKLYGSATSDLLSPASRDGSTKLSQIFAEALRVGIGREVSPEDTLAWIYAVLYTPSYRIRYADFLRRDFPRIPLTTDRALFDLMVAIGHELIALHTMEQKQPRITRFDVAGSNEVVKVRYLVPIADGTGTPPQPAPAGHGREQSGRVYINDAQFFDGVPQGVWDTHIGGYRVAEKWLKDRKGRPLSFEDVMHYHEVIAALSRTLQL